MMREGGCLFDMAFHRWRRERAALAWGAHDFLLREAARRLAERLGDVAGGGGVALDVGCHGGEASLAALKVGAPLSYALCVDPSPRFARTAAMALRRRGVLSHGVACAYDSLPFASACFDLALSCFSLHWANDLGRAFGGLLRVLRPGGLLLVSLAGAGTLQSVREALFAAEEAVSGGVHPRVLPFPRLTDCAGLLGRVGFREVVADSDEIAVRYRRAWRVFTDLRGMGESNALRARARGLTKRAVLAGAAARLCEGVEEGGSFAVRFHLLTLTARAPAL